MSTHDPQTHPPWATYYFDGWTYSRLRFELTSPAAVKIPLTTGEHQMLRIFLEHPQVTLSRDFLFEQSNPRTAAATTDELRRIDIAISRLRHKIEANSACPDLIKTIRYAGYYFTRRPESYPSRIHVAHLAPNSPIVDE